MRNHWIDENTLWANNYVAQIEKSARTAGFTITRAWDRGDADILIDYGEVEGISGVLFKPQNEGAKLWLFVNAEVRS